jgi:heptosyltransferase-2
MKIAIFLPNWIGDVVMATPALKAIREHFADAYLIGVIKPYVAGVLDGLTWLDRLIFRDTNGPWSRRMPAVVADLRRERPDLAILFTNSFRSGLMAYLSGCRRRVGYARDGRSCLLTDRLEPLRDSSGKLAPSPIIESYNRLAVRVGCTQPGYQMELATSFRNERAADVVWRQAGLLAYPEVVCLNPGGAFGSAKHWPADYFAELARLLVDQRGCGVLVLCGPSEKEMAGEIVRQARLLQKNPAVHSLADYPMSLGLTKACVRRADLLITTDSGPRHFAAAFNRPVVTLFGPTHINWTETYYPQAIHLQKKVDCGPCQLRTCPLDHRCMKLMTPQEVFRAAQNLLASRIPQRGAG